VLVEELFSVDRDDLFFPPGSPPGHRPGSPPDVPPQELL
jgi:hypothetical protein